MEADAPPARHPAEAHEIEQVLERAVELLSEYRYDHMVDSSQVDGVIEHANRLLDR